MVCPRCFGRESVQAPKIHVNMAMSFHLNSPHLFRYYCSAGLDVIRSLRMKVTPPIEFNDPFEFLPRVETDFSRQSVVKQLVNQRMLKSVWKELQIAEPFESFKTHYLKLFKKEGSKVVGSTLKMLQDESNKLRDGIISFMSARFGLICYSEVPDDILMWAHYARGHTGFAVGFDAGHPSFRKAGNLAPVVYRSERVTATYGKKGFDLSEVAVELLRSKSPHWSYEKEWRQLFNLRDCNRVESVDGAARYFKKLPPKAIHSVILGNRCPPDFVTRVLEALDSDKLRHVHLQRAVLHERDYKMTIEDF